MTLDPKTFGKVALVYGGWSGEREVSLNSGKACLAGLMRAGVDVVGIDLCRDNLQELVNNGFDRVFNVVHGPGGEDGVLQGVLEAFGLPYTGCGVKASAVTMDKIMTKQLWQTQGVPTPAYQEVSDDTDWAVLADTLGLPLIVKPAGEGSSLGMSRVSNVQQLAGAYEAAAASGGKVFVEQWISGEEYTVSILGEQVLPAIRLETTHEFYDYSAKYQSGDTQYHCPCGLDAETEAALARLAMQAFKSVDATGWGRVDFMRDAQGQFWPIEVNTVPGMTDQSLVPKAARAAGIEFESLLLRILQSSLTSGDEHGA